MGADENHDSISDILMREFLFYRIVDARESLLDRVILVRDPLLICVNFLAEKRGLSVTCVLKNSTSSV